MQNKYRCNNKMVSFELAKQARRQQEHAQTFEWRVVGQRCTQRSRKDNSFDVHFRVLRLCKVLLFANKSWKRCSSSGHKSGRHDSCLVFNRWPKDAFCNKDYVDWSGEGQWSSTNLLVFPGIVDFRWHMQYVTYSPPCLWLLVKKKTKKNWTTMNYLF